MACPMMTTNSDFVPRPGALRFEDEQGKWISANPHDPLYSTVSMGATEFWSDELQAWCWLFEDDE